MAQEMALILSTPVEELVPKLIAWNNTELLAEVKNRLVDYKGRVYDDGSIAVAKTDRATLNKFATALDNERKRIKKVYTAPLDKFTAEVNEVISAVNAVSAEIDVQVKAHEEKRQMEKLAEIKAYYAEVFPENLVAFIPYERIHQKEWLNASKNMAAVKREMDATIEKIVQEITTIETLKSEDEVELKAIYFETLNLASTLTAHERKKAEKQRILDAMATAKENSKQEETSEPTPIQASEIKECTISFEVKGTAAQLNALSAFLKENNYHYKKI